ncbi:MAG: NUDIX hydrolase [Nereida ignava]|mgnify:FL=1|uniref:NUDIX hydrolase n=1 Tax=Nereida ignava TaxID=282199 RepID=UPI0030F8D93E
MPPHKKLAGQRRTNKSMKQLPLSVTGKTKYDLRTQFSALPFRVVAGKLEILLITSRGTGRWIIPKGWPMADTTPSDAAATEAFEEAGVEGKIYKTCIGLYSYTKQMDDMPNLPCVAMVYPLKVKKILKDYPEVDQRKRKWFSQSKAAKKVDEPELRAIISSFDRSLLS